MDANRAVALLGLLAVLPVLAYVQYAGGAFELLTAANVGIVVASVAYLFGAGPHGAEAT